MKEYLSFYEFRQKVGALRKDWPEIFEQQCAGPGTFGLMLQALETAVDEEDFVLRMRMIFHNLPLEFQIDFVKGAFDDPSDIVAPFQRLIKELPADAQASILSPDNAEVQAEHSTGFGTIMQSKPTSAYENLANAKFFGCNTVFRGPLSVLFDEQSRETLRSLLKKWDKTPKKYSEFEKVSDFFLTKELLERYILAWIENNKERWINVPVDDRSRVLNNLKRPFMSAAEGKEYYWVELCEKVAISRFDEIIEKILEPPPKSPFDY